MESQKINSIQELALEIARLKGIKRGHQATLVNQYGLLKNKVESPIRFVNNIVSTIPGAGAVRGVVKGISRATKREDADWLTNVLQLGAPLVLNTTLLRNSGWVKKLLVLLASETAIGQVNQSKISGLVSKLTGLMKPSKRKHKKKAKGSITPEMMEKEIAENGPTPIRETY
ncbi:MAG: hypothetical protein ACTJHT_02465 [Sphingobacterium sp.]